MQLRKEMKDMEPEERYAFFWSHKRREIDAALSACDMSIIRAVGEVIALGHDRRERLEDLAQYATILRAMRRLGESSEYAIGAFPDVPPLPAFR